MHRAGIFSIIGQKNNMTYNDNNNQNWHPTAYVAECKFKKIITIIIIYLLLLSRFIVISPCSNSYYYRYYNICYHREVLINCKVARRHRGPLLVPFARWHLCILSFRGVIRRRWRRDGLYIHNYAPLYPFECDAARGTSSTVVSRPTCRPHALADRNRTDFAPHTEPTW